MAVKKLEEVVKTKEELKQLCTDHLIDMVVRKELRDELKLRFQRMVSHNAYQQIRMDKACEMFGYNMVNEAMQEIDG